MDHTLYDHSDNFKCAPYDHETIWIEGISRSGNNAAGEAVVDTMNNSQAEVIEVVSVATPEVTTYIFNQLQVRVTISKTCQNDIK